ncbi:MAG: hypothetical protein HOJ34_03710 [Kordiimonadaceae bacterium]|jgi:mannose-6-phosphate isomerase-like protein (cupin superfamily)|nr:hypothetical protein [Kordiimonadaceae bacterium]MBT6037336.1 hypothetical protein [Kordiimonadaceae bacterium]MBT6328866.1 hypothetical protein [Kordiimonadaceae bacterium]MBT7582505.1 hypothetical protein [Kordiimonadaceae bacterium]
MRAVLVLIISLIFPLTCLAQSNGDEITSGVFKLTPEIIEDVGARLKAQIAAMDSNEAEILAFELIGSDEGYNLFLVRRGNTGTSEIHRTVSDLHTAVEGNATLVIGGELVNEFELSPGQMRGTSIKGGTEYSMRAGDAVNIPANVSHHVVVAPGEQYMYFVYQVDSEKLK